MTAGFWIAAGPLILASGSVPRRLLLESAGIPVVARAASIDERGLEDPLVRAGETPASIALHLARAKALTVSPADPGSLVLGGDQTLSLGSRSFHKPKGLEGAAEQLTALAGHTHVLNSAVVLVRDGAVLFETVGLARLTMRPLTPAFIAHYLAAVGPSACDSVGAYKLEGLGVHLFERVEGDQSTVMGLPLLPVLEALRDLGVLAG